MIQFKLKKEWVKNIDETPFKIVNVTKENVFVYENDIKWLINCFHKRYDWDGFLKWTDIINRLENGKNIFFLCEYNNKFIGWVWGRTDAVEINKDNLKFYSKLPNTMIWAYNNFMVSSKIINKPENASVYFLNLAFNKLFEFGYENIVSDVETSNDHMHNVCNMIGMRKENWICDLITNTKDNWGN